MKKSKIPIHCGLEMCRAGYGYSGTGKNIKHVQRYRCRNNKCRKVIQREEPTK